MANKENVGDHYPLFNQSSKRAHFNNPISSKVNTDPARIELVETFQRLPGGNGDIAVAYNLDFEILGTGSDEADVTFGAEVGGIKMETDAAGSQQVIILPHLNSEQSAWKGTLWGTENQVIWEAVIRTGSSIADTVIWAGLKLTNVSAVATDDDQAMFRYDGNVATWEATTSVTDSDVETATSVTVAADTNYYFRIEIDSDRKPHYFIDDKEVAIGAAMANDIDLIPYVGVEGNAKSIYLIKEKISRILFE